MVPQHWTRSRSEVLRQRARTLLTLKAAADQSSDSTEDRATSLAAEIDATLLALRAVDMTAGKELGSEWQGLQSESVDQSSAREAYSTPLPSVMAVAVNDPEFLLVEHDVNRPGLSYWEIRTLPALAALGIVALMVGVVLIQYRATWRRWVAGLPVDAGALGLFILGMLWWFWFKTSLIGVALMLTAATQQWLASRARPSADSAAS
jgi:hypothetical protein